MEPESAERDAIARFLKSPSEATFRDLFLQLCPKLLNYFRLRGCEPSVAEELTQDVMLTVYREIRSLRDQELFRPWLFKIARNGLLQEIRKRGRRIELVELVGDVTALPAVETDSRLMLWMSWLEPAERQVMIMRYVEELDYAEIALALDIPLGTVQWRIFNSKKKLAKRIDKVRV